MLLRVDVNFTFKTFHLLDAILHGVVESIFQVAWSFLSFRIAHDQEILRQPDVFYYGVYVIKFMDTPRIIIIKLYVVCFFMLFMCYNLLLFLMLLLLLDHSHYDIAW